MVKRMANAALLKGGAIVLILIAALAVFDGYSGHQFSKITGAYYAPDAVPDGALAAITGGVVSEVSGAGSDFDVTYIRRTPEYEWNAQKNWPDVGEKITFTAHVINKGSITAFDVEYEWKLYDLSNNLVAENKGGFPKIVAGEEVTAALDWNWQDGPYKLVFVVDPANKVQELFEANNELEEFTNSYLVAFKVEKTLYDWFNSKESCKDVPGSYFVWANGSVKPGYRCGTKSWEDWAQRQIRQFNEFLVKAEDEHLGKVRHSLPRMKLQRVYIVDDNYMYSRGGVFYHNCPFDYVPERKYYDSSWGFEKTAWTQPGTPESIDGYAKNPEWLVVERSLIHELGHTFNRPHLDVGKLENGQVKIKDASGNFVFSQEGVVYLCDEKICVDDIITNPGSSKGFSKYTALGLKYQFGYSDKARKVPVRIGHRNGCEGYGDDYPETLKSELQLPKSNKLKVVGIDGNPVPNVDVSIYLSQPQRDFMPYVDDVPDLKGKTDSNGIFDLGPYPLAPPGTEYPRIGRSFVIKISQGDSDQYRFLDVMHMNLELWEGNSDAIYLADVTALGNHNSIINFGGKSPDATNLALGEKAEASINSGLVANANDGNANNPAKFWEPVNGEGKVGDWWEVDLARLHALYQVVLYSHAGNYNDWYSRFHIDVSEDRKTWETVAAEADWDKSRSGTQAVLYTFSPKQGRFVRIISDTNQNDVKLQEVEVYGLKDSAAGTNVLRLKADSFAAVALGSAFGSYYDASMSTCKPEDIFPVSWAYAPFTRLNEKTLEPYKATYQHIVLLDLDANNKPVTKKNGHGEDIKKLKPSEEGLATFNWDEATGAWILNEGPECTLAVKYDEEQQDLTFSSTELVQGKNFASITPQMMGKSLAQIKGSCEIIGAFSNFLHTTTTKPDAAQTGNWDFWAPQHVFTPDELGLGMWLLTDNMCRLSYQ